LLVFIPRLPDPELGQPGCRWFFEEIKSDQQEIFVAEMIFSFEFEETNLIFL